MRSFGKILLAALMVFANTSFAQVIDCTAVLQNKLINLKSAEDSEALIARMQANVCNRQFISKEDVRQHMRSGGFSLNVFDIFDASLSDSKAGTSGAYSVERTEFCDKSSSELARSLGSNYLEKNGQFVLDAFNHCVKTTNADLLYLEYELHDYGSDQIISGNIHRVTGLNPTSLGYRIEGFTVTPSDAGLSCKILGHEIPSSVSPQQPILVSNTPADITCSKEEDRTVSVSIQTSEGAFRLISPSNAEDARLKSASDLAVNFAEEQKLNASLRSELETATRQITEIREKLNAAVQQREAFKKRHNASLFTIYTGDGGWQGARDIYAPCGTGIDNNYGVAQCATRGMDYWHIRKNGVIAGGRCGHAWFSLLCQAR